MKTVRFSRVVEKSGKPEMHLVLMDPDKDSALQRAIKQHRVMTVQQNVAGNKADHGVIGYDKKLRGQFLIFPRSLASFAERKVVGINYDLLEGADRPSIKVAKKKTSRSLKQVKVIKFPKLFEASPSPKKELAKKAPREMPVARKSTSSDKSLWMVQKGIKEAIQALDDGKQVKVYKILERLIAD